MEMWSLPATARQLSQFLLQLKLEADDKNLLIAEGHQHLEQMPPELMLHRRQEAVFALFCQFAFL